MKLPCVPGDLSVTYIKQQSLRICAQEHGLASLGAALREPERRGGVGPGAGGRRG